MKQSDFDTHAHALGMNAGGSGLAFLLCRDNPKNWRLEFLNESTKVGLAWYIGPKHYSTRLTDDQFLKLTRTKLDKLAALVENANEAHDKLTAQLKELPKEVKKTIVDSVV